MNRKVLYSVTEHLWSGVIWRISISFPAFSVITLFQTQWSKLYHVNSNFPIAFSQYPVTILLLLTFPDDSLTLCKDVFSLLFFLHSHSLPPASNSDSSQYWDPLFPHTVDLFLVILLSTSGLNAYSLSSPYFQDFKACTHFDIQFKFSNTCLV